MYLTCNRVDRVPPPERATDRSWPGTRTCGTASDIGRISDVPLHIGRAAQTNDNIPHKPHDVNKIVCEKVLSLIMEHARQSGSRFAPAESRCHT
jgi:hypothetical protein